MIFESNDVDEAHRLHRDYWRGQHFERVVRQLMEEQAELTIELQKFLREEAGEMVPDRDRIAKIIGEMADVLVCLEYVGRAFAVSNGSIREAVDARSSRLDVKLRRLQFIANAGKAMAPDYKHRAKDV